MSKTSILDFYHADIIRFNLLNHEVGLRGNLIVNDGEFIGELGQGKFVKREPYGHAFTGLPIAKEV